MNLIRRLPWLVLIVAGIAAHAATPSALPGDSMYQLALPMTDQDGRPRSLADLRGGVTVVSLFYTSCPYMCPLIIDTLRQSERALDDDERSRLSILLVSLDAEHDTPAVLKAKAVERKLDTRRWTLARTDAAQVRKLAALLDIQYRELADGGFSHSSKLVLLDRDGRIVASTETMGKLDDAFMQALRKQLATR